jgi:hypothetical protein
MAAVLEKFSTQVNAETLKEVREIAKAEGRLLQSVVDEAFADVVQKHKHPRGARPHVMAAYRTSHGPLGALYRKLAE